MTIRVGAGITQSRKQPLPNPDRLHSVPAESSSGEISPNQQNSRTPGCRSRDFFEGPKGAGIWAVAPMSHHLTYKLLFTLHCTATKSRLQSHFTEGKTEDLRGKENSLRVPEWCGQNSPEGLWVCSLCALSPLPSQEKPLETSHGHCSTLIPQFSV